jgi:hypothetical protein
MHVRHQYDIIFARRPLDCLHRPAKLPTVPVIAFVIKLDEAEIIRVRRLGVLLVRLVLRLLLSPDKGPPWRMPGTGVLRAIGTVRRATRKNRTGQRDYADEYEKLATEGLAEWEEHIG